MDRLEDHDRRVNKILSTREGHVDARDRLRGVRIVLQYQSLPELLLYPEGLLDGDRPRVTLNPHHPHLPITTEDSVPKEWVEVNFKLV